MQREQSFVNTALIYSATLIVVKIIGAFYKIFLGNVLTTVGTSYYAFTYPYFNAMLAITTVGFPAAIAKIISEYLASDNRIMAEKLFVVMRRVMLFVGFAATAILFIGAPFITALGSNPKAVYAMQAISIALIFVAFTSVYRGYFQGHSDLFPFGMSQIADQIGRVIFGVVLAGMLLKFGDEFAAAGATFAATLGTLFGVLTLIYYKRRHDRRHGAVAIGSVKFADYKPEVKRVVRIAIPIIIGASVMPLVNMIDSLIIINRLKDIGYAADQASSFYSYHSYFAASLVNFPQVIFTAIQASLLPAVSFLIASHNALGVRNTIRTGMKISLLIGVPAAVGLAVLSQPILALLYPSKADVIAFGPDILKVSALALIPLSLFQATTGILQGMEKQKLPAYHLLFGALFKIVVCYSLVGIPVVNVKGAGLSTILAFTIAAALNVYVLIRESGANYSIWPLILKPLLASVAMAGAVMLSYQLATPLGFKLATVFAIAIGIAVYGVFVVLTRALDRDDLAFLPGKKILSKFIR